MSNCHIYQSPIDLRREDVDFNIKQQIFIRGKIINTTLNENKQYIVHDKVILIVNGRQYQLQEYHFHHFKNTLGCEYSEHALEGLKFDAEIRNPSL